MEDFTHNSQKRRMREWMLTFSEAGYPPWFTQCGAGDRIGERNRCYRMKNERIDSTKGSNIQ